MQNSRVFSMLALLPLGTSAGAVAAAPAADWHVSFGTSGRATLYSHATPQLHRHPGTGALYVNNFGQWHIPPVAARIDASGNVVWTVLERLSSYGAPQYLVALADGTMMTAHGNVTRYSGDGSLLWSETGGNFTSSGSPAIVELNGEIIVLAVGSRDGISRLDRATGARLESIDSTGSLSWCHGGTTATYGNDTIYWANDCGKIVKIRLAPLRIEWVAEVMHPDSTRAAIAADASGVYAGSGTGASSRLEKFSSADGSIAWSATGNFGNWPGVLLDVDGHPVGYGASTVEKLDRGTGKRRWLKAVSGLVTSAAISSEAIVIAGNAEVAGGVGFVERLRGGDGASQWRKPLLATAAVSTQVTSVVVDRDHILAAGVGCAPNAAPERCDLILWPTDLSGNGGDPVIPHFALNSTGTAARASSETTVGAAFEWGPAGMQLRIKRVRNGDGMVMWDAARPVLLPNTPGYLPYHLQVAVGEEVDGAVAVLYSEPWSGYHPRSSDAVIAVFDGADGEFKWERSLLDASGGYTDLESFTLGVDSAGNVFASIHEGITVGSLPTTQSRRQIRKYAASTGNELLRIGFEVDPSWSGRWFYPPRFRVAGDDLLVEDPPIATDHALTRIDGQTGQIEWSNPQLGLPHYLHAVVDGKAYLAGSNQTVAVMAGDLVHGTRPWMATYANPADLGYAVEATYLGSDGSVYAGGYRRIPRPGGSPTSWDSRGLLMRLDATTGAITWVDRFDDSPVTSPSGQLLPVLDHAGIVYSWQRQARAEASPGYFFTGVSSEDGSLRGTQVVHLGTVPFPELGPTTWDVQVSSVAGNGDAIVYGDSLHPSQPFRFALAKWPAPRPFEGGSLRVDLGSAASRSGGVTSASFTLVVSNNGVLDASNVDALLAIPDALSIDGIECSINGDPCDARTSPNSIGYRLDLPAGSRLRMSGNIRTRQVASKLAASAFAPYGFVEMDMKDNIRSLRVDDILFSHGFD